MELFGSAEAFPLFVLWLWWNIKFVVVGVFEHFGHVAKPSPPFIIDITKASAALRFSTINTWKLQISVIPVSLDKIGLNNKGLVKKSVCWTVHLLVYWFLLLFWSEIMHRKWMKMWFLTCQMPNQSGKTYFDPFLKTWKLSMKYSKNGWNLKKPKNAWNVLFDTMQKTAFLYVA